MRRLLYDKLLTWKERENRKPLILKGVRQCGKTFLLREFGEKNYADVAYFNFEGNTALRERFAFDLDVRRIVAELSILRNRKIDPAETLLIFDEVQFCNEALVSLKYFCEEMPEQHVVCAGSLIGIALSKSLSFPVGKVSFLTLRPMNFFEFLMAHNEDMLCDYLKTLSSNEKVSDLFVPKMESHFRNYVITGGMPEAVGRCGAASQNGQTAKSRCFAY